MQKNRKGEEGVGWHLRIKSVGRYSSWCECISSKPNVNVTNNFTLEYSWHYKVGRAFRRVLLFELGALLQVPRVLEQWVDSPYHQEGVA